MTLLFGRRSSELVLTMSAALLLLMAVGSLGAPAKNGAGRAGARRKSTSTTTTTTTEAPTTTTTTKIAIVKMPLDNWHCGHNEETRQVALDSVHEHCPALADSLNRCCHVHDACYGEQRGQEPCDDEFCTCARAIVNGTGGACPFHVEMMCWMMPLVGSQAYHASAPRPLETESNEETLIQKTNHYQLIMVICAIAALVLFGAATAISVALFCAPAKGDYSGDSSSSSRRGSMPKRVSMSGAGAPGTASCSTNTLLAHAQPPAEEDVGEDEEEEEEGQGGYMKSRNETI